MRIPGRRTKKAVVDSMKSMVARKLGGRNDVLMREGASEKLIPGKSTFRAAT